MALTSSDADASAVATVVTGGSAEIAALPGTYHVAYGVVTSPQLHKVVATVRTPSGVSVTAGQDAKIEMGGPFTLDFSATLKDNKITVSGSSFSVKGKNGELYSNLQFATEPELALIVGGKTILLGKMPFG